MPKPKSLGDRIRAHQDRAKRREDEPRGVPEEDQIRKHLMNISPFAPKGEDEPEEKFQDRLFGRKKRRRQ